MDDLIQTVYARSEALVKKDVAAMNDILADGFFYTNSWGVVSDKTTYIQHSVASQEIHRDAQTVDDLKIYPYGEFAIVSCRVHDQATFSGGTLDAFFRSTFVYQKVDGRWRCLSGHTSGPLDSSEVE